MQIENARQPWDEQACKALAALWATDMSEQKIADTLGRSLLSIEAQAARMRSRGQLPARTIDATAARLAEPYERIEPLRGTDAAEAKMLKALNAMGGFPEARTITLPGTDRTLTIHIGSNGKPHPLWLAKHMPEGMAA